MILPVDYDVNDFDYGNLVDPDVPSLVQNPVAIPVLLPSPPPPIQNPPPPSPPPLLDPSPPPLLNPSPPAIVRGPDDMKPGKFAPPIARVPISTDEQRENYPPPVATILIPDGKQGSSSQSDTTTSSGMSTTTKIIIAVSCSVGGIIVIAIMVVLCCYCGQQRRVKHAQGRESDLERGQQNSRSASRISRHPSGKTKSQNSSVYKMNSFDPFLNESDLSSMATLENASMQVGPRRDKGIRRLSTSDILRSGPVWRSNGDQRTNIDSSVGPMAAAAAISTTGSLAAASLQSGKGKKSNQQSNATTSRERINTKDNTSEWLGIAQGNLAIARNSSKSSVVPAYNIEFSSIELNRPVGKGSFGTIYEATWNETQVAVKFLGDRDSFSGENPQEQHLLSVLESEAAILASLRHPNIVQFIGVSSQPPCIVSEYVEKGNLSDLIRNTSTSKDLSWAMLLKMLTEAATGMLYLHARTSPIIHCDLKSNNILVDSFYRAKICDFNLSRLLEQSTGISLASVHNPRWIAPEVLDGIEDYSKQSDVYSFGVVMWEVLTRDIPWRGVDIEDIVTLVREGARPQIPNFWDVLDSQGNELTVFEEYVDLMTSCWSQNPYDRPSFADIVKNLKDISLLSGHQPVPDLGNARSQASALPIKELLTNESTRAMTDSLPQRHL